MGYKPQIAMNKTDIYIPFASGTRTDELRYCLRSIEKYLHNVGHIYIITSDTLPEFTNITRIFERDEHKSGRKEWNIINKIRRNATGKFLFMNDDHFLLSPYDAGSFPNYYSGTIFDKLKTCSISNPYRHTISNTARSIGQYAKYFDIHCPMLMDASILHGINFPDVNYGYCFKSVYASHAKVEGVEYADWKSYSAPDKRDNRKWFSVHDNVSLVDLQYIFPNKSKYEL